MERLIVWHRWLPPPEAGPEATAIANAFASRARMRFGDEGGKLLARVGGCLAMTFDPAFGAQVTDACVELHEAFDAEYGPEAGALSHAITAGLLEPAEDSGSLIGDAIDRAQALANRARGGEIVLDETARALTFSTFLFSRELNVNGTIAGEVLDRATPRRHECRKWLAHLSPPPLPGTSQPQFLALRQVAQGEGRHRLLLLGTYGAGTTSWLSRLADEFKPPVWLNIQAIATPLAPLGALCHALRRLARNEQGPERILDPKRSDDAVALATLTACSAGQGTPRRDIVTALRHWFARTRERTGKRVWITMSPLPLIDPATSVTIADALRDPAPEHLLIMRMGLDGKPPDAFLRNGGISEIRIPALNPQEARALAQAMLGKHTPQDIAKRAAVMGGNTPLGVAEAVRSLVSGGELLYDGEKFSWRRGPAGRVSAVAAEVLIDERTALLEADVRRVLEILVCVPDAAEDELVLEVARADGLSHESCAQSINQLHAEALIEVTAGSLSVSPTVRDVVQQRMPPARLSELHRFIAQILESHVAPIQTFARATLGYYLAHGGRSKDAVEQLLAVAGISGDHGFLRSGVRLAASAVECDPSTETRERAARLAQALSNRATANRPQPERASRAPRAGDATPVPPPEPQQVAGEALAQATRAIISRDFDAIERCFELLVAAGKNGAGLERLRAMSLLSKGDTPAARQVLVKHGVGARPGKSATRTLLAQALIDLQEGQPENATRAILRALARAREKEDRLGERAGLLALAMCYRALARGKQAEDLEHAAGKLAALPSTAVTSS